MVWIERDARMRESPRKRSEEMVDSGVDQAKDAAIEGGVDERAEERRREMIGVNFRTGDLVSYWSVFSGMELTYSSDVRLRYNVVAESNNVAKLSA
jgi:hypothetical protein